MALTTGTRIGPYQGISSLGVGGMAEVYRETDTRLHREVALKFLALTCWIPSPVPLDEAIVRGALPHGLGRSGHWDDMLAGGRAVVNASPFPLCCLF